MKRLPAILLLAAGAVAPARAQHGTVDAHEALFTVMAAINAAGYDAQLDSPTNHPVRRRIREQVKAKRLPSVEKIRKFYEDHTLGDWTAELSQYISFALVSSGPPDFRLPEPTYQLPPDVQRLLGLEDLIAEFYEEADVPSLFQQIQPAVEEFASRYHRQIIESLFELNGYLRNPTSGVSGRSFQIVICLLGAPNQVHTRSFHGNYYVVVTPSVEFPLEEIRYTYLHYVLEPVVTRAADALERISALGDYALGAPYLPEHYKRDFRLLATSSLIKAILARLADATPDEKRRIVEKAYRQGYILAPHFYEQLPLYERQPEAMRLYFRDMVEAVDLAKEERRAQNLEFDEEKPVRVVKPKAPPEPELSAVEKAIEEAEDLYRKRDLEAARRRFLDVLRMPAEKRLHARAYYGLARIATLRNDPELASSLFRKALETGPEAQDKAWILFYLGRLSDVAGDAGAARAYYRRALAIPEASPKVRELAQKGVSGAFRPRPQR